MPASSGMRNQGSFTRETEAIPLNTTRYFQNLLTANILNTVYIISFINCCLLHVDWFDYERERLTCPIVAPHTPTSLRARVSTKLNYYNCFFVFVFYLTLTCAKKWNNSICSKMCFFVCYILFFFICFNSNLLRFLFAFYSQFFLQYITKFLQG